MATAWARASILFRDNAGNIAKSVVLVLAAAIDPSGGAVAAIRTAAVAIMKAISPRAETGGSTAQTDGAPDPSDYGTVEDRLVATFAGDDGSTTVFEVPGPIDGIFVTDGVTLDPTNTTVASWISYVEATFLSEYGGALTFVKGRRSSKKQLKI